MPGPLIPTEIGRYVCSDGHDPVMSTLDRCWYCGKPAKRIKSRQSPNRAGWRYWKCGNLQCEAAGERFWGPYLTPCPECGYPGPPA